MFFDREGLEAVASATAVGEGLRSFKEHRVVAVDEDQGRLWAQVEDDTSEMPCTVEVTATGDILQLVCDCDEGALICRHMVAALYAYAEQKEATGQLFSAADTAIRDRMKRGRTEVTVKHLSGQPWFGDWQAESLGSVTHFPQRYRVTIRSLKRRANICNCPDFRINQLGTCKHIEAVLHKISKRKDYSKIKGLPAPFSYVYLAWDVDDAPQIRVHRGDTLSSELQGLLDRYFMVAVDSYEEQVFALVRNKQDLFDNVIGEDASEDVVGVSKKLLETLVEDLAGPVEQPAAASEGEATPAEPPMESSAPAKPVTTTEDGMTEAISRCIKALQQAFGPRIERIFGSGGGLVTVLDRVDDNADRLAEQLSTEVPVALIDRLALKGLQRLGGDSPLAGAHDYYDATTATDGSGEPSVSPLCRQAQEKLKAARLLFDQQLSDSALEMVLAALLSAAADKAGLGAPLNRAEAGIWAYAEALPQGMLDQNQVSLLMRALSFAQGGTAPAHLVNDLLEGTTNFVASLA